MIVIQSVSINCVVCKNAALCAPYEHIVVNSMLKHMQKNRRNKRFGQDGSFGLKKIEIFVSVSSPRPWVVRKVLQSLLLSRNWVSVESIRLLLSYSRFPSRESPKWLRILGERAQQQLIRSAFSVQFSRMTGCLSEHDELFWIDSFSYQYPADEEVRNFFPFLFKIRKKQISEILCPKQLVRTKTSQQFGNSVTVSFNNISNWSLPLLLLYTRSVWSTAGVVRRM